MFDIPRISTYGTFLVNLIGTGCKNLRQMQLCCTRAQENVDSLKLCLQLVRLLEHWTSIPEYKDIRRINYYQYSSNSVSVCLIELVKNKFIDFNNYCVPINWLFGFNEMKTTLHIKEEPVNATNNTDQSQRVVYTCYGSLVDNNTCSIEHATSIAIGQYSQCYFKFCN